MKVLETEPRDKNASEEISPPRYDARALTDGGAQATICLDGQAYTLRITRLGKLILTK